MLLTSCKSTSTIRTSKKETTSKEASRLAKNLIEDASENIGSPYKSGWTTFDLSKTDTLPLSNFAEIMTDSIINAGILFREK